MEQSSLHEYSYMQRHVPSLWQIPFPLQSPGHEDDDAATHITTTSSDKSVQTKRRMTDAKIPTSFLTANKQVYREQTFTNTKQTAENHGSPQKRGAISCPTGHKEVDNRTGTAEPVKGRTNRRTGMNDSPNVMAKRNQWQNHMRQFQSSYAKARSAHGSARRK